MNKLSLKCKIYADRPHDPCSGTTDDGNELTCECWCHSQGGYPDAEGNVFGETV